MEWYKWLIALALGIAIQVVVAELSFSFFNTDTLWYRCLMLPFFAPESELGYSVLFGLSYFSCAISLAFAIKSRQNVTLSIMLSVLIGTAGAVWCLFFFVLNYEMTAFFIMSLYMASSVYYFTFVFARSKAASIAMLPATLIHVYLWMVTYCITLLNFA